MESQLDASQVCLKLNESNRTNGIKRTNKKQIELNTSNRLNEIEDRPLEFYSGK